jgi:hypothetical protein
VIACKAIDTKTGNDGKRLLDRIVSMLVKISSARMQVRESIENEYENENE